MTERWFIIKHEECGSILTIKSSVFRKEINKQSAGKKDLRCPSCRTPAFDASLIDDFLKKYDELTERLKEAKSEVSGKMEGFTIREIKGPIDPDKLDL